MAMAIALLKKMRRRRELLKTLSPRDRWRYEHGGID